MDRKLTTILVNMKLIYQDDIHDNLCVMIKNGLIADIFSKSLLPSLQESDPDEYHLVDCHHHFVSPGFIDLQVYGSGGLLFGTHPDTTTLQRMEIDLLSQGTTGFLVTMATNCLDRFKCGFEATHAHSQSLSQSSAYRGNCWGVHLEGPYINPIKRGAHPLDYIRTACIQEVQMLLEQAKGTLKMMTIAPELVSLDVQQLLVKERVVLSSGHSNATLAEGLSFLSPATAAVEVGGGRGDENKDKDRERDRDSNLPLVRAVTHLYNAMPPMLHRPGSVGYIPAIFKHHPYTSIIADGIHVDYSMLALAKRELGDKLFLITDAVTETHEGIYQHRLHVEKEKIKIKNDLTGEEEEEEETSTVISSRYVMPDGTLSGSALTMLMAVRNCVLHTDSSISLCEAVRMASLYPARLLGVSDRKGRVEVGFDADLCIFNGNYEVVSTYMNGECVYENKKDS